VLLVGFDDTDSRAGGCTTSLAQPVRDLFPRLTPAGPARLVRLNPNVPWKTRGNGAVALSFEEDAPLDDALARVRRLIERVAQREEGTSPGIVVSRAPLPPWLYEAAVTRIVERGELPLDGATMRWWGGRGVIGAAAALSWPAKRTTWERIVYRDIMTRHVDPLRVRDVELSFPTLFDTYDLVEDDVVCVPSSPCPVLWGLRGTDPDELERASATLGPQRPARETLFLTNHASDDHLVDRASDAVRAYDSARVRGRVASDPIERNGHVHLEVEGLRCAAYAPTRSFRAVVAQLRAGDDVTVCGGCHEGPDGRLTLGIEKMNVHATTPRRVGNPHCPTCGRAMKSAGRGAGYRCCGSRATAPRTTSAALFGWYEVPSSARRHLARPLKLGLAAPEGLMCHPPVCDS